LLFGGNCGNGGVEKGGPWKAIVVLGSQKAASLLFVSLEVQEIVCSPFKNKQQ